MNPIRFPLNGVDEFNQALLDYLNENIDQLYPALNFGEQDANDRVEIDEVTVNKVNINDDGTVEVEYEYSWSFYAGCKDINDGGLETDSITGRIVAGAIEFDTVEPPEPRSTYDEL